jgi:hypothetical protein
MAQSSHTPHTEKSTKEGYCLFLSWMVLVIVLFTAISVVLGIYLHRLEADDELHVFGDHTLTFVVLYGYMRIVIHHVTIYLFEKCSPMYTSLLHPAIQGDTAYLIIDAASTFLWMPISAIFLVKLFEAQDLQSLFTEYRPFIVFTCGAFQVDRIIQLAVHYRHYRFVHHLVACTVVLLVVDWAQQLFPIFAAVGRTYLGSVVHRRMDRQTK